MGLLDELTSQVLGGGGATAGGAAPSTANIAEAVLGMMQGHGGLGGLAQVFQQKGLGDMMNQWVSTGPNPPMTADQAHTVFGPSQIGEIARKLGINPQMAAAAIAAVLPMIIDHMTPHGRLPEPHEQQSSAGSLLEQGLGMLRGSGLLG
jgi:uncharacterized protein YidB (DUF937 family)